MQLCKKKAHLHIHIYTVFIVQQMLSDLVTIGDGVECHSLYEEFAEK